MIKTTDIKTQIQSLLLDCVATAKAVKKPRTAKTEHVYGGTIIVLDVLTR
jgi:hypothetical protein